MAVSISASATTSSLKTLASLPQKALSLTSFSAKPNSVSFSLAAPSSLGFRCVSKRSPFVLRVAVSSEYDQDEDTFGGGGGGGGRGNTRSSDEFKLFVGNLPFNCDSAQLAGLFERAGNVEIVEVIYDKETGRSRGFAFVTMSSMAEVEAASQQFNGYELDGRALRVSYGPPPPRDESYQRGGARVGGGGSGGGGNQVYVGNLPWSADNSSLENLFSEQGTVVEAKVVYDRDSGRSRGFGFVTFETADEVSNAIEFLNGAEFDGRQIRVTQAEAKQRRSF